MAGAPSAFKMRISNVSIATSCSFWARYFRSRQFQGVEPAASGTRSNRVCRKLEPPLPANVQAERSVSLWIPAPDLPGTPVEDSRPADLVVVGGGMAGLSVAYEAVLKGRQVTVIDRGPIASGMTARA